MNLADLPSDAPFDDLDELYRWANEKYFDRTLPAYVTTQWNDRLTKAAGDAGPFRMHYPNEDLSLTIRLSEEIRNNHRAMLNVMVHEMIHVWQIQQAQKTQNNKFLDPKNNRYLAKSRKGHSTYFQQKMHELNARFPELDIDISLDLMATHGDQMIEPLSGFVVEWHFKGKDLYTLFAFNELNIDLTEDLVTDVKSLYGNKNIRGIIPIESYNPVMSAALKLTKSNRIRKTSKLTSFSASHIEALLEDESTTVNKAFEFAAETLDSNIHEEIQLYLPHSKCVISAPFVGFLQSIVVNCETLSKEFNGHAVSRIAVGEKIDGWNPEWTSHVYDHWANAELKDIMATKHAKSLLHPLAFNLLKNKGVDRILASWARFHDTVGSFRLTRDPQFKELVTKALIKEIKKSTHVEPEKIRSFVDSLKLPDMSKEQLHKTIDASLSLEDFKRHYKADALNQGYPLSPQDDAHIETLWRNPSKNSILMSSSGFRAFSTICSMMAYRPDYYEKVFPDSLQTIAKSFGHFVGRIDQSSYVLMLTEMAQENVVEDLTKQISPEDHRVQQIYRQCEKIREDLSNHDFVTLLESISKSDEMAYEIDVMGMG